MVNFLKELFITLWDGMMKVIQVLLIILFCIVVVVGFVGFFFVLFKIAFPEIY